MSKSQPTLYLSAADIAEISTLVGVDRIMDALIEDLDAALKSYEEHGFEIPARDGFRYTTPYTGLLEWMPLMQHEESVLIKLVGYHPENPERFQIPTVLSSLSLFDTQTGLLKVLADGTLMTSLRTGAASAVASRYLANAQSTTLGLIGAGAQAVTQLHAISRLFPLERILVYDINPVVAQSFSQRVAALNIDANITVVPCQTVVEQADILTTATSIAINSGPVFDSSYQHQAHLHINAIGSDLPGKTELPKALLDQALVCPDFLVQALQEGECQQLEPSQIGPAISHIANHPETAESCKSKLTVLDSTGFALQDYVALTAFHKWAEDLGIGTHLSTGHLPEDPYNPYGFLTSVSHSENPPVNTLAQAN